MKKLSFFLALVLVSISFCAKAHDFYSVNSDGDTIYYNFLSPTTSNNVGVTFISYQFDTISSYSGEINIPSTVSYGGVIYSVTSIEPYAFISCTGLTSVSIPSSITSIGEGAFLSCSSLNSIIIPSSITSIGNRAFAGSGLNSIIIPSTLTSIGDMAFFHCNNLSSITVDPLNPNYSSIDGVLYNKLLDLLICSPAGKTGNFNIPSSVTSIYNHAFSYNKLTSIIIPNTVTSIGFGAFSSCSYITSIIIPNSITTINNNTFSSCNNITLITIPPSVTSIGEHAFSFCTRLSSVVIGSSVTSIDRSAFWYCDSISSIRCDAINPPTIQENSFYPVNTTSVPVYVPCNSVSQYQSAQYWSNFTNIQGIGVTTNIIDSVVDGNTYNQYGFNETTAGVYTQNLQTINGCDSIVTLTLSIYTLTTPESFVMQNNQDYIELSWQGNGDRYEIIRNGNFLASVTETTYQDIDVISGNTYCYQIRAYADNISSELSQETCQTFLSLNNIEDSQIKVNLYPNPTTEKSTLELEGLKQDANVFIYDMMGKTIKTYKVNSNLKSLEIELNDFKSGIYNVKIINSDLNINKKLIVQ